MGRDEDVGHLRRRRIERCQNHAADFHGILESARLVQGKKVFVALTRGGQYRNTPADTQVPYLRNFFTFLGMTDVQFIYAEGLAMGPEAERQALASAQSQIEEALPA